MLTLLVHTAEISDWDGTLIRRGELLGGGEFTILRPDQLGCGGTQCLGDPVRTRLLYIYLFIPQVFSEC